MTIKIGINGMGRIGRMVVRSIVESKNKNLKINHINNRSNSETTSKLIKYDSIHGKLNADLDFDPNHLIINKNKITFSQETKFKISIEAGSSDCWKKFVGDNGIAFGIDEFGKSAPYKDIYKYFGLESTNIKNITKKLFNK